MLNQVTLIGNLGKDAEVRANGGLLDLRVATTHRFKNKQGEYINETQWHTVKLWSKFASEMAARFVKGAQVVVSGSLTYEEYNGDKQAAIKANSVRVLKKGSNDGQATYL